MGEEVVAAFVDTWNRHDMTALAALMAEDAEFVNIFGSLARGREEIRARHAHVHETVYRQSTITPVTIEARYVAPDIALVRWIWRLTGVVMPDGKPAPERTGVLFHVVRRDSDRFQILASQNTSIVPAPF